MERPRSIRAGKSHRDAAQWRENRGLHRRGAEIHRWRDWLADSHRRRREDEVEGHFHSGEVERIRCPGQFQSRFSESPMMSKRNRRAFLQTSTGALAAGLSPMGAVLGGGVASDDLAPDLSAAEVAPRVPVNEGRKPLRLGL